jgi:hypothetical protein
VRPRLLLPLLLIAAAPPDPAVGLASFTHVDRAGAHYVSVGFYGDVVVWDAKTGAPIRPVSPTWTRGGSPS